MIVAHQGRELCISWQI